MNFSANKNIESLNNPEYKFLVSLKKIEIGSHLINQFLKVSENVINY